MTNLKQNKKFPLKGMGITGGYGDGKIFALGNADKINNMKNLNELIEKIIKAIPELVEQVGEDEWNLTRPITFENVLVAMNKLAHEYFITTDGTFYCIESNINDGETQEIRMLDIIWQLNKPLDQQSEETIKFLNEIL